MDLLRLDAELREAELMVAGIGLLQLGTPVMETPGTTLHERSDYIVRVDWEQPPTWRQRQTADAVILRHL